MDLGLQGKTALVTGASSGLGLASAVCLAAEGARVAMVSRDADKLHEAAGSVGNDPIIIAADLSDPASIDSMLNDSVEHLGAPIDILVANAGGPPRGNFATTTLDAYPDALQLNMLSTIAMCKGLIPGMQERGWGRVVAITSATVRSPSANLILSNTARAGLTAFLKTTATEVAGDGVTVNSVQPGMHATPRLAELGADLDALGAAVPTGVIGRPEDFGAIVTFLCSDQARFVTGAALQVDGGAYSGLQ